LDVLELESGWPKREVMSFSAWPTPRGLITCRQVREHAIVNALDDRTLFPHDMATEHDRLVLIESCGQAQVRRAG
jgi:hypothetical protein